MCGKFSQMYSWREIVDFSQPLTSEPGDEEETVTPMRMASVLHLDEARDRRMTRMRWGWSKPEATGKYERPDHIHARAETIDTRPTFREAFFYRRGVLVVHTFNEGEELPNGKTKQHVITPNDGKPVGIAVIWQMELRDGLSFYSFVMVTVCPNQLIGTITDRMPAVLQQSDWPAWLGEEEASVEELKALLKPFEGDWTMQPQETPGKPRPARPSLI
jgi:putative SOS response-associated peptidase YedK